MWGIKKVVAMKRTANHTAEKQLYISQYAVFMAWVVQWLLQFSIDVHCQVN